MSDKHYVHPHDENDLEKVLKQSGTWFETYGTTVIYGLAAVLAAIAVGVFVSRTPPATAAASAIFLEASTPEEFRDLADQFPGTPIGIRARLRQGELQLNSAVEKMFTNRKLAIEELDLAQKAYERLEQEPKLDDDVRQRVLSGLARVIECRCDGSDEQVKKAIAAWERLQTEYPQSMLQKLAEDRIKRLSLDSTKSFYAWFQQQDPKPEDQPLIPQDGPPAVPAVPNPFQMPDFSKLGLGGDGTETPKAAEATPSASPAENPAPNAAPAATETPAQPEAASPAAEPAAAEPPPADAAPAQPAAEPAATTEPAAATPEPATSTEGK
jgi:hypothetical protein